MSKPMTGKTHDHASELPSQTPGWRPRRDSRVLLAALVAALATTMSAPADEAAEKLLPPAARSYKLDGPWLYKVTPTTGRLTVEDLNGDGRADIAAIANDRSLLKVYQQMREPAEDGSMFELRDVALDRTVRDMVATDVDGDGRVDLVLAGMPPRLAVMYQDENGNLQAPMETTYEADRLVLGDLNNDKRPDLLVYRDRRMMIFPSDRRAISLEPAVTFPTTTEPASTPMIIDLDGDGRNDIVYHNAQQFEEIVVRLQTPEGTFPSEFRLKSAVLRSVAPLPSADHSEPATLAAVQNNTRQIIHLAMARLDESTLKGRALPLSEIHAVPFDPDARLRRPMAVVTDVDGDGRPDLLTASPELARLRVLQQNKSASLQETLYPSLMGIEALHPLTAERGKPTPIIFFSREEKAIGFAVHDTKEGTLAFPRILPIPDSPLGAAVLPSDDGDSIAVLTTRTEDGKDVRALQAWPIGHDGKLGEPRALLSEDNQKVLEEKDLVGVGAMDFNRDGLHDLILYGEFRAAQVLLQQKDGKFTPLAATSGVLEGLLSSTRPGSLIPVQLEGPKGPTSILAVKEKFARAFHIDDANNVVVEDQFNGRNNNARLTAAALGSIREKDALDLVLLDRGSKVLTIYSRQDGTWQLLANVDLDDANYAGVNLMDLNGDGRDDILLTAEDRVSIIYSRPLHGGLETIATATTPVEDGGYGTLFTADVIPGGNHEIVGVEMRDNVMEFLLVGRDEDKRPALQPFSSFRVFDQERALARRINLDASPEPREVIAADLNGNGRNEIITITHDNIIVYYPQE